MLLKHHHPMPHHNRCSPRCQAAGAQQQHGGGSGSGGRKAYRLRRARVEDAPAVSDVMAEVFGSGRFAGSGVEDTAIIQELEAAYSAAISREGDSKLADALLNKEQAALAARAYRMTQEAAMLRAQLAFARGHPAVWPTEGPNELRQLSKWRRTRKFVCLVVEELSSEDEHEQQQPNSSSSHEGVGWHPDGSDGSNSSCGSSGRVVATATLSMMQAEAALPPPFPSNAPMRAYISNMAVVPSARRQGLAKTLCSACGRIAKAWGEPCVLLHVASDNTSAQQLYAGCGFIPVSNSQGISGLIKGPWTQQRMVVDAAALAGRYQRLPGAGNCRSGSSASAAQATSLQPHRADAA